MTIENDTLILNTNEINYILYNTDKSIMLKTFRNKLKKHLLFSSFKTIRIPGNISFQNIPTAYKNVSDLIDTLHSYGETLFPYNGFEINSLSLNDFNDIVHTYLKNNLSVSLNCSEEFSSYGRNISINLDLCLNNETIYSTSDFFNFPDN